MEIWQIALLAVIGAILILGAVFVGVWPVISRHCRKRKQDQLPEEETKEEVASTEEETPEDKPEGTESETEKEPETEEAPAEETPIEHHTPEEKRKIEASKSAEQIEAETENAIAVLFGGKDNIVKVFYRGSRVTVQVKDTSVIRSEDFDRADLSGALIMSDRIVFPVGENAAEFCGNLKKKIGID